MNSAEQILHDRVNLVRLVRRLEKSVNESDWESERNITLWLKSQGLLQVRSFPVPPIQHLADLCLAIKTCKEVTKRCRALQ
jgi:hypothetical protein